MSMLENDRSTESNVFGGPGQVPVPLIHELVARDIDGPTYVAALQSYAEIAPATRHRLLKRIEAGHFRAPRMALHRFFREYYAYSRQFTRFLATVIASLERPEHRAALLPNGAEEAGYVDDRHCAELHAVGLVPNDIAVPHPLLFRRFLLASGLRPEEFDGAEPHVATTAWIKSFEALCRFDEATAVGALGLATEGIVRSMYQKLLVGIRRAWPALTPHDRAFFELHALVDDDHAEVLRKIAVSLSASLAQRRLLAVGTLAALNARACFYDQMDEYLQALDAATLPETT